MAWYWIVLIVLGSLFAVILLLFLYSAGKLNKLDDEASYRYHLEHKDDNKEKD